MGAIVHSGRIAGGIKWASSRWAELIAAHADEEPDLGSFYPGTLNVDLNEAWTLPEDLGHRERAHRRGLETGIGFLRTCNYIHPTVRVLSIDGHRVDGRVYVPGREAWANNASARSQAQSIRRLEIVSRVRVRTLLGLEPEESANVTSF